MYCQNCGARMPDHAAFCPSCGMPAEPAFADAGQKSGRGGNNRKKAIILLAAVIVLSGIAGALAYTFLAAGGAEPKEAAVSEQEGEDAQKGAEEEQAEAPAAADVPEPDEKSLKEFLRFFMLYGEGGTSWEQNYYFDCRETDPEIVMLSIMWNVPCVDYGMYPGESQAEAVWEGDADPRGWAAEEGSVGSYYIYDAGKVDWIMRNIFNYSQDEIDAAVKREEKTEGDPDYFVNRFYREDGRYYYMMGGLGWETEYDVTIDSLEQNGEFCDVSYSVYESVMGQDGETLRFTARMQYKEVDGDYYWSMYHHEKE